MKQVIDPTGPPILLLYGASGVGKSSLLDAGLVPRLEAGGDAVRYRRRDQQKGLLGSLRDALQLAVEQTALDEALACRGGAAWQTPGRLPGPGRGGLHPSRPGPTPRAGRVPRGADGGAGQPRDSASGQAGAGVPQGVAGGARPAAGRGEASPNQGVPEAARPPRDHRGDPWPGSAGAAPAAVPARDRGRLARGHRRRPAGRRRLRPGVRRSRSS